MYAARTSHMFHAIAPALMLALTMLGAPRSLVAQNQSVSSIPTKVKVHVRISASDGAPARFAELSTFLPDSVLDHVFANRADANGVFRGGLAIRGAQTYRVLDTLGIEGAILTVDESLADKVVNVALEPLVWIEGRCRSAVQPAHSPIPIVRTTFNGVDPSLPYGHLRREGQSAELLLVATDKDGSFAIAVPPGRYRLTLRCQDAIDRDVEINAKDTRPSVNLGTLTLHPNTFAQYFGYCAPPLELDAIRRPPTQGALSSLGLPRATLVIFADLRVDAPADYDLLHDALTYATSSRAPGRNTDVLLIPVVSPMSFDAVDQAITRKFPDEGDLILEHFSIGLCSAPALAWWDAARDHQGFLIDSAGILTNTGPCIQFWIFDTDFFTRATAAVSNRESPTSTLIRNIARRRVTEN